MCNKKLLIVAGAVVCALVIGAAVYNACTTTTFGQALGLPENKIVKVAIDTDISSTPGSPRQHLETTDRQIINDVMAQLNSQKFRFHPFAPLMVGWAYYLSVYSSDDAYKVFDLHGFSYFGNFAGSKLQGPWDAEDADAVYQIMRNFYIELGGQPVE